MSSHFHALTLAKDRHYLRGLKQKIKRASAPEEKTELQAKYDAVFDKSHAAVVARYDSLPDIELNAELPVSNEADKLIKAIQHHQVIIVAGETGSGKTTQLPKIAMLAGRGLTGQIGHTQPRRLAARSVSQRIAEELGESLGKTVSYKVRFHESGNHSSIVKLMTDGILLAELARDRFLTAYDTLIIDEAHERSLNIDFILGYLKQLLPKRPDLKVIITSATLDVNRFSEYFTFDSRGKTHTAPVFEVEGRSHPVEIIYQPVLTDSAREAAFSKSGSNNNDDNGNYDNNHDSFDDFEEEAPHAVAQAVEACFDIARNHGHADAADILIFASTEREIRELAEELEKQSAAKRWQAEVLMLFARQSLADQQRIFHPATRKQPRRIIISTNVAETAVTVPNIRFVIDLGFHRISRYSYRSRVQRLPIEPISQAAANQRAGRCGRIAAGTCIRLYSEQDFLSRPEYTEPEIKRTNLASVILQMANLRLGSVDDFDFIDPPDYRLINDGRKLLAELGAFKTHKKGTEKSLSHHKQRHTQSAGRSHNKKRNLASYQAPKLSKIGQQMATMPIDPRLARILIAGHQYDCLREMLIIVSALSVQDPRERPADKTTQADQKHALFKQEDSDFLFYTALWQHLHDPDNPLSGNARKRFAKSHFLSWLRLREWDKTHEQLSQLCKQLKFTVNAEPASYDAIHKALLTGLLSHIARKNWGKQGDWGSKHEQGKDERGTYLAAKNKKVRIFPASSQYKRKTDWVVAFEVVETTQVYLRCVAKIDPEWLLTVGKDLLKYHYFEPHWSKKTGRVQAYAQVSLYGLTVVAKQSCNYEHVDVAAAHEIFLRDALTAGNVGISAPFLTHNLNKLAHVALMEDKLRRKDLLVDEEDIYQFYARKIPEHIASRQAFEFWRKDVEKNAPKLLFFQDDDVLAGDASALDDANFPHNLNIGELKLPLTYVFDPSRDDDGVTVRVPQVALPQIDAVALTWGIPGWRDELVMSLLRGLPKQWRKKIVPIPDTAAKLMDKLNTDKDIGLLTQLTQLLWQMGVTGVQVSDFDLTNIPDFLRPRVQVIDERKKTLAASRDILDLQVRFAPDITDAEVKTGLHTTFPEHFVFVNSRHQAGVVLKEYHALKPAEDGMSVNIATLTDIDAARQLHFDGVVCLLKVATADKHKQIKKMIDKPLQLAFSPLGDRTQLETMLIHAAASKTVYDAIGGKLKNLPITQADFNALLPELTGQLLSKANDTFSVIKDIYLKWQQIRHDMLILNGGVLADNIADIEDQLDGLHLHDFITRYPFAVWQAYPRYLQALKVRIGKLSHNFDNDSEGVQQLDKHMNRLADVRDNAEFHDYKWLVEEYRISLFAQPMKTKQPVSEKRLEALWERLTRSKL